MYVNIYDLICAYCSIVIYSPVFIKRYCIYATELFFKMHAFIMTFYFTIDHNLSSEDI